MIDHCLKAYPFEGCGLLIGSAAEDRLARCIPTRNASQSSRLYEIDPRDLLHADRAASEEGYDIIGVFHSHTHTDPYPSPTDVAQAPDPGWHYVLVSLRHDTPSVRSYRIVDGSIKEEALVNGDTTGGSAC